jgi:hypothetical protein
MKRLAALIVLAVSASVGTASAAEAAVVRVPASPLTVRTSVSPRSIYVADVVTARVEVFFDRHTVDAGSVRLLAAFGQWQQLAPVRTTSTGGTPDEQLTWTFTVACLSVPCVPRPKSVGQYHIPRLTVTARTKTGARIAVQQVWPTINIAARFEPPGLHAPVPFIQQTAMPGVSPRLRPRSLATTLLAVGALLVAAGIGIGALELRRRPRRSVLSDGLGGPIARTLALVRLARAGRSDDKRRAVGLLARTLAEDEHPLSSTASALAWSESEPSADELDQIVQTLEGELEKSR